jgi:hypothetical protein
MESMSKLTLTANGKRKYLDRLCNHYLLIDRSTVKSVVGLIGLITSWQTVTFYRTRSIIISMNAVQLADDAALTFLK